MIIFKKNGGLRKQFKDKVISELKEDIRFLVTIKAEEMVSEKLEELSKNGIATFPKLLEETQRLQSLYNQNALTNGRLHENIIKEFTKLSDRILILENKNNSVSIKEISGKEFWSIWIKKKKVHLTPNGKYEKGIIALYGDCNNPEYLIKLI